MICVTGADVSLAALASRMNASRAAPLQELRLDLLDPIPTGLPEGLPRPLAGGLIVTLRDRSEGGRFQGSLEQKERLLHQALEAGAAYVDLEADAPDSLWRSLASAHGEERLIASVHRFTPFSHDAESLRALLARLERRPAGVLKLAVSVGDVCELAALRDLAPGDGRPLVRIGMGLAGRAGRVAWRAMGSPWTYVAAPGGEATAPGQVAFGDLEGFAGACPEPRLLALMGGPGVADSPGPAVYTRLAREEGLPLVYVAAPTASPVQALALLETLGLIGASVTMPHKTALFSAVKPLGFAARVGAVNTVVPESGEDDHLASPRSWLGHNTDGQGVLGALAPALSGGPRRAVILGAGGAARAAAFALADAGHAVTLLARRPETAVALAAELGPPARGDSLDALESQPFDVLVNATPLGRAAEETLGELTPLLEMGWRGRTVLDMSITPRATPLLTAVEQGGGAALPGIVMWAHQGAEQWRLFTGRSLSPERLLDLAREHLAEREGRVP